jgi:hypothetical protein
MRVPHGPFRDMYASDAVYLLLSDSVKADTNTQIGRHTALLTLCREGIGEEYPVLPL